jgi:uncharacterized protein (TIGR02757 family)
MKLTYQQLETLYSKYNKFEFIHPDPLEFVYNYSNNYDREIVGLIASSLAYGNVKQILKSVSKALTKMNESPKEYIQCCNKEKFYKDFNEFKHRFTTGDDFVNFLSGIKSVLEKYNSLENCFAFCYKSANNDFKTAVTEFTNILNSFCPNNKSYLLPSPINGSACKRLMLYFRWMIRKDNVDPGCWHNSVDQSSLIIPLDTHMFNISKMFNFTIRKTADLKTAVEITENFASINPADPVKYDFVLTRFGIRDELNYNDIN